MIPIPNFQYQISQVLNFYRVISSSDIPSSSMYFQLTLYFSFQNLLFDLVKIYIAPCIFQDILFGHLVCLVTMICFKHFAELSHSTLTRFTLCDTVKYFPISKFLSIVLIEIHYSIMITQNYFGSPYFTCAPVLEFYLPIQLRSHSLRYNLMNFENTTKTTKMYCTPPLPTSSSLARSTATNSNTFSGRILTI